MYEKTYGQKYDSRLSTVEIAARIRADIKTAKASGNIHAAVKVSVRAKGSSIGVTVTATPFPVLNRERALFEIENPSIYPPANLGRPLSDAAQALKETLQRIMDAYNFDGSDIQTDYFNVNFHGHAEIHWKLQRAEKFTLRNERRNA